MKREIWTATKKDGEFIYFEIEDMISHEKRNERRYIDALPLMFEMGGYPAMVGALQAKQELPWSFKKVGVNIYMVNENDTKTTI